MLGISAPCFAIEPDKLLKMDLEELMNVTVVTASKSEEKISKVPGTMLVFTQQQIKERGYLNLLDLLEDLPGVDVNRKNSEESLNTVAIRGNAGNNKFIIMQNGVRINSPTGEQIPISYNFPLFQAERVEILYGGASAVYGPDAFTGVINIITKKGKDVDGGQLAAYVGSDGFLYNYLNVGKKVADKWDIAVGGHWLSSNEPDLSDNHPGRYGKTDLLNTSGTVARPAAQRENYTAPLNSHSAYANIVYDDKLTLGMTRSSLTHPTTTAAQPRNTLYSNDAIWETILETYYAKYRFQPAKNLTSESLVTYASYTVPPDSNFTNNIGNFKSYKYAEGDKLQFRQELGWQVNEDHKVVGGATAKIYHAIPKTADLSGQYNTSRGPGEQNLSYVGTNNMLPARIFDIDYESYGAFLNIQSQWSSWVSTSMGARFDYDTRFGETFNPRLGLILDPTKQTTVKLLYSESFLAPAPYFAYAHFGTFTGATNSAGQYVSNFFQIPNPSLKPEKGHNHEINISHKVTPNFILSAAGYYNTVDDMILSHLQNSESNFIPGGQILSFQQYQNVGEATIYGLEVRSDYQMFIGPASLKFWGSYSWVDGDIHHNGKGHPLPMVAGHKIKGGATLAWNNFFITPKVDWIGESNIAEEYGFGHTPSYTLVNLAAGWENFYDKFSLFLNIHNMADLQYYAPSVGLGGQLFPGAPQDPRRFFGGVSYKF